MGMEPLGESAETTEALLTPAFSRATVGGLAELRLGNDHLYGLT